jgi:two-component system CheB/CheR fusion protein
MSSPIVPVVGIGASAGGLEAFTQLLKHLPLDTGLAFVLVQHLDPKHESMLTGILSRETQMPVEEVQDGASVQPNRVYVIPPNASMTISGQVLRLKPREQISGPHMPIDQFLRSLAASCKNKAIGVILSGTGSDGALGLEAIKAEGGIIFAQDAESARFNSMPLRALATGCVDFVLPPEQIAGELARIGQHPYVMHPEAAAAGGGAEAGGESHQIFAMLRAAKGVDFSLYKQTTIARRIRRRLALHKIATLPDYVRYLQDTPAELEALYHEILIKVTGFFRDAGAFDALKDKVIPQILKNRSPDLPIRVWVPGCASGEEAYSIAICLLESAAEAGVSAPIQIFASDISEPAIERARAGSYLENVAADISPERLERFFVRTDGGYQVSKPVRELCIFTKQDLISDPPFSKLDLISCRNVLIYLGPVQKRILPVLHYALKPGGFLMLGVSETIRGFTELFRTVDKKHKVFCRKEVARRIHLEYAAGGLSPGSRAATKQPAPVDQAVWNSRELQKKVDLVLLARYSPPGVVVDEDMEILEIRGHVGPYLELAPGKASLSLAKVAVNAGLAVEIRAAIREAREKAEPVRKDRVQIEREGQFRDIGLEVVPLDLAGRRPTFLVLFEEPAQPLPAGIEQPMAGPEERAHRQILQLKQELASTKKHMLELIEDHEVSRDESQSVAEETLSTNEELQSINEELETAKEELQATNEEMASVNDELENRNTDLRQSRDFALSIVNSIRHPLLVLGMDRRVMSANRSFYSEFRTSPAETEGRSFFELGDGHFDIPELRTRLDKVLYHEDSFENFEFDGDCARIGRRVILFSASRLTALQMVLLTMEDITARRDMENTLRSSEEQLRQSQKLEAVGRLAGGIAHDFNNLLTVVMGHSDMLLGGKPGEVPDREALAAIRSAGERGAALTQQLLAFSRRQVLQPKVLDLGDLIAEFERMLRRLIGEHIELIVNCGPALWRVKADPGQVGRVIMNLALNARDAMPQGGTLTMELGNVRLDEAGAAERKLPPGGYVMLAVSDTGIGMDAETQAHLFEPFFTTKTKGVGTGLGLPVVLGIVEQSGGAIRVQSEVGRGTTFRIYLPQVEESSKSEAEPGVSEAPRGSEVVLLVEDEDGVRQLGRRILERAGYTVIEARHGKEGLSVCESREGPIHILVTDVLMPGIGGRELAERAALLRPEMKALFVSGHTDDSVLNMGIKLRGTPFLQKPFTLVQLAKKVREVLDGPGQTSRSG